ncbi:MAG TPA: TonB-dependent receptor plug domain-containing protein, partial [Gemmatimonadaceae bacterium]|nr:TonB-dependent receptor plug domain-containing protein [Gemmatimonadaceae bacterium]
MISKLSGRTFKPHLVLLIAVACVLAHPARLHAQGTPAAQQTARDTTARDSTAKLRAVEITAKRGSEVRVAPLQLLTLPVTASITAQKAKETVNLVDPEDAVKYLPSLYIRKRNYGDTQATIGTRVWGVSSSARSLVYADGVPLSALIANNNTIGGPRWGLVSPEEISRIDIMYGPYSAAYPGNSMGAVMEITTRQPSSLEGSVQQTQALQHYNLYGTDRTFGTSLTNATLGDRFGRFSFWASG